MQDMLPQIIWRPILDRALALRFYPNLWASARSSRLIWIPWDVPHYMRFMHEDLFEFYMPNDQERRILHLCTSVPNQPLDTLQYQLISRMAKDTSAVSDDMLWEAAPRHVWITPWSVVLPTLYDAAVQIWNCLRAPTLDSVSKASTTYMVLINETPVASLSLDDEDAVHVIADYLYQHCADMSFTYTLRKEGEVEFGIPWHGTISHCEISRTPHRHPFDIPPHLEGRLMDYFLDTRFWDFIYYIDRGNGVMWVPDERIFSSVLLEMKDDVRCTTTPCRWDSQMLHCNAHVKRGSRLSRLRRRARVAVETPNETLQRRIMRYVTHHIPLTWFWSRVPKRVYAIDRWTVCASLHEVASVLWQSRGDASVTTRHHLRIDGVSVDADLDAISQHIQRCGTENMECQWGTCSTDSDEIVYNKPIIVECLPVYHPPSRGMA